MRTPRGPPEGFGADLRLAYSPSPEASSAGEGPENGGRVDAGLGSDGSSRRPPPIPLLRVEAAKEIVKLEDIEEDGLSEEFLRHFCGTQELFSVDRLEIQVDSVVQSVEALGDFLPNLRHLRLSGSSVLSIRDLGVALQHLEVLWMSRCGLQDLGGVTGLPYLREFYLPFNDVADLSAVSAHECLEVLDIEGNAVADLAEIGQLSMCASLRELTLAGNPLCRQADFARVAVLQYLPQILVLDDVGAEIKDDAEAASFTTKAPDPLDPELLEADLQVVDLLSGLLGHNELLQEHDVAVDLGGVSGTDSDDSILYLDEDAGGELIGGRAPSARNGCDARKPTLDNLGGKARIQPLEPAHLQFAQALLAKLPLSCTAPLPDRGAPSSPPQGDAGDPFSGEPDEQELVLERLKKARPRPSPGQSFKAFTARSAATASLGWRHLPTADHAEASSSSFRPATTANSGIRFDDLSGCQDSSSDLTCGGLLAGNPLAAVRQRRTQATAAADSRETGMDIRELLRTYQTCSQPSCMNLTTEEKREFKREAELRMAAGTPDVRIHSLMSEPGSRPGSAGYGRPGSARGSRPGSATVSGYGSRPGSAASAGRPGSASGSRTGRSDGGGSRHGIASSLPGRSGPGSAGGGLCSPSPATAACGVVTTPSRCSAASQDASHGLLAATPRPTAPATRPDSAGLRPGSAAGKRPNSGRRPSMQGPSNTSGSPFQAYKNSTQACFSGYSARCRSMDDYPSVTHYPSTSISVRLS